MGMGLFLPRGILDFLVRVLHKKKIPTITRITRIKALKAIRASIVGKYMPILSRVAATSLGKVRVVESGADEVELAAL